MPPERLQAAELLGSPSNSPLRLRRSVRAELLSAEKRGIGILPIATMMYHDILSRFGENKPKKMTAVLIGPENNALTEAGAMQLACYAAGIDLERVLVSSQAKFTT